MLVDGIAVTANTYEETKRILLARHGDTNRIIQAHLNFLVGIPPAKPATPGDLNITFIVCHRRAQTLGYCSTSAERQAWTTGMLRYGLTLP